MGSNLLLILWNLLLLAIGISALEEFHGAVGGSVYLSTRLPLPSNYKLSWKTGGIEIAGHENAKKISYSGRCNDSKCELFTNATLKLFNVSTSDKNDYEQSITDQSTGITTSFIVKLSIHSLLTSPSLRLIPAGRPISGTNKTLQCDPRGQIGNSYTFYKDHQAVSCTMAHVTCQEKDLYFHPITQNDHGTYTCTIHNPVSSNESNLVLLDVAVSVSNVSLHNNESSPVMAGKDSVALRCLSIGTDVSYSWDLRDQPLPLTPRYNLLNNNSTLIISPVSKEDHGNFTCTVTNYLNNETSQPLHLNWLPDGQVFCGANRIGDIVQLRCSWPGGYPPADLDLTFDNTKNSGKDQVIRNVSFNQVGPAAQLNCHGIQGRTESCSLIIDKPKSTGLTNETVVSEPLGKSAILNVTLTGSQNGRQGNSGTPQLLPTTFTWYRLTPEPLPLPLGDQFLVISTNYFSYMVALSMTKYITGHYMCTAENMMGRTDFIFMLNINDNSGNI
ncbi:hypothetical protein GDO86_012290 [Hymenochirus boettgeri]|uniref:Ig-like domain-containing protein n=1 Tax=Hymenochirus boettgeri TaxID=247094 RepID=A0A8T2ILP3_9PIPI|nr:hypothetical protein GDO86_012290 [Hymenochirus boettgeri]